MTDVTTQGSATPRTALRDALDATFPTQAGDRAPHDYADLLWMALSQRGFAIEAEAVSELRVAVEALPSYGTEDNWVDDGLGGTVHEDVDVVSRKAVLALLSAGDKAEAPR